MDFLGWRKTVVSNYLSNKKRLIEKLVTFY